jgi:hypothetical protein
VWGELNHSASEPAVELSRYRSEGRHCEPQTWARKFNRSRFPKGCTPSRSAPTRSSGGTGTATNSRCGKSAIDAGRSAADGTLGCWSGTKRIRRTFSGRWPEVRQCGLESVLGLGNPLYGVQEQIRLRDAPAFFWRGIGEGAAAQGCATSAAVSTDATSTSRTAGVLKSSMHQFTNRRHAARHCSPAFPQWASRVG